MHLKELTLANGVSGNETEVRNLIAGLLKAADCEYRVDRIGNLIAHNRGRQCGRRLLLSAHMDEVGLMITGADEKGMLSFRPVGGISSAVLGSRPVSIGRERVAGVTTAVDFSELPADKPQETSKFRIDIGASSREEAEAAVRPGDYASFVSGYTEFGDGFVKAKALDDRAGCSILLDLLERKLDLDFYCAFTVMEEVGLRGAKITAERLRPALAICLEGTPADDNFTAPDEAQGALKKGVQIRFRDGSMVAHPGLVAFARRVAEENNIPHQCAVRTGGGTNGGSIHLAPGGVPTLVLGIPVRYAHTHYGYSAAADVDAAIALTCAILRALTPDVLRLLNPMA